MKRFQAKFNGSIPDSGMCLIYNNGNLYTPSEFKKAKITSGETYIAVLHKAGCFLVSKNIIEEEVEWGTAMKLAEAQGASLPSRLQATLIYDLRDEFDDCAMACDGDNSEEWGWTCAEYSANDAFYYYGYNGTLSNGGKYGRHSCRGVLALDVSLENLNPSPTIEGVSVQERNATSLEDIADGVYTIAKSLDRIFGCLEYIRLYK